MMNARSTDTALTNTVGLLSRLLLAFVFVPAGLMKLGDITGTAAYISSVGLPFSMMGAVLAILVEVACGAALLIGYRTRVAAAALALFTATASVFFHAFWAVPADQVQVQQLMFFKNVGVIGGLLALAAFGAGRYSLDARRKVR